MSIVKDLKNARTKIESMQADLEAVTAERDAANAERDAFAAQVKSLGEDHDAAVAALNATVDAVKADAAKAAEASAAEIAEAAQVRDEQAARIVEIEGHAAELTRALEDPGYRIAKSEGTDPASDGGEAGGGQAQSLLEQLNAITDPGKRNAFYQAHKAEIKAEAAKSL